MPGVTLTDLSLKGQGLTARVAELKQAYFRALPEVCIERAVLVTRYSQEHGYFGRDKLTPLDKAKLYRYVLENREPVVRHRYGVEAGMRAFALTDRSLFAGSTTSKYKGVPLYPEFMALALWPELSTVSRRDKNPYGLGAEEAKTLNEQVFPCWLEANLTELARKKLYALNEKRFGKPEYAPEMKLLERLVFFIASKPNCISHTIPDFSRAVHEGLRAVAEDARSRVDSSTDAAAQDLYRAMIEVVEGIVAYSHALGREARRLAGSASDAAEREELLRLAEIHEHVPEHPARSFREALTTIWICWIGVHLENPNVGMSLGRLDQVLYEHYQRDVAGGALSVDQALELLCCLWLKIGDHVPTVPNAAEQLFGGTGSNQAITIGGVPVQLSLAQAPHHGARPLLHRRARTDRRGPVSRPAHVRDRAATSLRTHGPGPGVPL